jgi:hypothetical protein
MTVEKILKLLAWNLFGINFLTTLQIVLVWREDAASCTNISNLSRITINLKLRYEQKPMEVLWGTNPPY